MAEVRQRRKLTKRKDVDWEQLIKECLHKSSHTARWGCLDKNCKLFRIINFKNVYVPQHIVSSMELDGRLTLKEDGFFKYTNVVRRRTAKPSKIKFKRRKIGVDTH